MPDSSNTEEITHAAASKLSSEPPAAASKASEQTDNQEAAVRVGAGYSSTEEEAELRQQPVQPQPVPHQPTAFPIPPLAEHADSLMRQIDTLSMPNVSPDSGIQSIAGSPSGNDSPGSVTSVSTGEAAGELQPSATQTQSQAQPSEVKDQRLQESSLLPPPPPPPVSVGEDKKAKAEGEDICKEEQSASSGKIVTLTETVCLELDQSVVDVVLTEIPSPFRGPSIGRKKRGRPLKRNKTQMLQHKKSTLYSGLYTSDSASASSSVSVSASVVKDETSSTESTMKGDSEMVSSENKKPAVSGESESAVVSVESKNAVSAESDSAVVSAESEVVSSKGARDISEAKELLSRSEKKNVHKAKSGARKKPGVVKRAMKKVAATDSKQDAPPVKKRGRGRPKGSKNKRFTVVKNRVWKARIAKGVIPIPVEAVTENPATPKLAKGATPSSVEKEIKKTAKKTKVSSAVGKEVGQTSSALKAVQKPRPVPGTKGKKSSGKSHSPSRAEQTQSPSRTKPVEKRKRGRPRKIPLPEISSVATDSIKSNAEIDAKSRDMGTVVKPLTTEKSKAVADSELASLIQSVQHSIRSQFPAQDIDESSEFTMDTNNDISGIEPSLPRASAKTPIAKVNKKASAKPKKPKLHVMMRKPRRRKRKHLQKDQPKPIPAATTNPPASEEPPENNNSFHDLSQQQHSTNVSNGSLFGPSASKPLGFFNRYRPSR